MRVSETANISVLLPSRDAAPVLGRAIESVYSQSVRPREVIVVEDGSTDSSPALLAQWSRRWSAVRTVRTSGVGIARALNLGLTNCSQDWVARMDADDVSLPQRFERQLALASSDPRLALIGCRVDHRASSQGAEENFDGMRRHVDWANSIGGHEALKQALWIDSPLPHPSWLVRRSAFDLVGGYDESGVVPEDYDWLHRFFSLEGEDLRAEKCDGPALLEWFDSSARLTRTHGAYKENAFNLVKARSVASLVSKREIEEVFLFGLGPKGKTFLENYPLPLRALVDVHPGRVGTLYRGLEVWGVAKWQEYAGQRPSNSKILVLICLGTSDAREKCEQLCRESGLHPGADFVSL